MNFPAGKGFPARKTTSRVGGDLPLQGMGKESTQPPPSPPCAALGPCLARPISRGKPSPKVSRPWQSLAITPGINRRPGAGGGIDCAEGDSGPPGNGCEPSWARPCEASGALYLSNGGSGGGHAACTLWPPPAPFGYFPARGKYLVRPQAGETSHKKHIPCGRQGKRALLFFSVS